VTFHVERWRDEMIKRDVARYNWKTGVREWGAGKQLRDEARRMR